MIKMVSEKSLLTYLGKDIEITCIDGDSVIGHVMGVSPAADTDDGEACIAIQLPSLAVCYEFSQSEIKSIKVIERPKK